MLFLLPGVEALADEVEVKPERNYQDYGHLDDFAIEDVPDGHFFLLGLL
jgi:hypothetical protein